MRIRSRHLPLALNFITLGFTLFLISGASQGASLIRQDVVLSSQDKQVHIEELWTIAEGKFSLVSKIGSEETQYLFNGRTFYICGRLQEAQLPQEARDQSAKILMEYKNGACIVAPTNFLIRFFLSPLPAMTTVDQSDALRVTLTIRDYKTNSDGASKTVLNRSCQQLNRQFTIAKQVTPSKAVLTKLTETLCQRPDLSWRQGLWPEVAKSIIRQPHSLELLNPLKQDQKTVPGLVVDASSNVSVVDMTGVSHQVQVRLTTKSIEETAVSPRSFNLPPDFKLFSDDAIDLSANSSPAVSPASTERRESKTLIHSISSVIFCALSGTVANFGCFLDK